MPWPELWGRMQLLNDERARPNPQVSEDLWQQAKVRTQHSVMQQGPRQRGSH